MGGFPREFQGRSRFRPIVEPHIAIVEHPSSFEIQHFFVYVFGGYPELGGEFRSFFKVRFAVTRKHRLRHPTSKPSSFFGSFIQCSHCGMQACGNNVGPMQLECWPCVVRVQAPCNQNASTQLGCRLQCAQLECRPSATRMHVPSSAIVQALCIGPAITMAKIQQLAAQQPAITVTRPANACAMYLQACAMYLQALCSVFAGLVQCICRPCAVYLQA